MDLIGEKLKLMREARRLTLKQLGDKVGCTGAHLSLIEKGNSSPSIPTVKKIAEALGVNIVDFFTVKEEAEPVVMKVADRRDVSLRNWNAKIQQLVQHNEGKMIQPFYTIVAPGGGSMETYTHVGEEFGIVIKGKLSIEVDGRRYEVNPGESFYYSTRSPHMWVNEGKEDVEVVWVVSPPSW